MSELLFELLTEEIPARMQVRAATELKRLVGERLGAAQLGFAEVRGFVTPRRLTLVVDGLPEAQPDLAEERKGPRVGAPEQAVQGFLRGAGVASLGQCERRATDKGEFWFAMIRRAGRPTRDVLPEILRGAMLDLPWPKSMRFPAAPFRWVRPLSSVVALFDGAVLPLDLGGIPVGDMTQGHRWLSTKPLQVRDFADYAGKLREAYVVLDPAERRAKIAADLALAATMLGVTMKDDPALLDEVTGLVEFPVVLDGKIDQDFMDVPPEVLTTSMRTHQKYFSCLDAEGRLAPRFFLVANNLTTDGGAAIVAGNERVLRARLSDAKFFWDQDRKVRLETRVEKLAERVFHAKLGTVLDKVHRMEKLVEAIAPHVPGADPAACRRAALLAKADLSTGMVGEFPELQGVMGAYYARHDGASAAVADAIAEHYSPLGPSDRCPTSPTSVVVALADKIDSLAGFFAIDEKPTGSKDPYALRRSALGIIRLIVENQLRLPLLELFDEAGTILRSHIVADAADPLPNPIKEWLNSWDSVVLAKELLTFFADRLRVFLRDQGKRHDLIAAVFALTEEDDLVRLLARVAALDEFLRSEDGANLLVAYRRASNIVRIEEKKDGRSYEGEPDPKRFRQAEESALAERLAEVGRLASGALEHEQFGAAMAALARLRRPVDEFFDRVTVNAEETELRENRLRLLSQIRATLNRVADFSKIEG
jgi:glycyl-tRNA synthetase beta chain